MQSFSLLRVNFLFVVLCALLLGSISCNGGGGDSGDSVSESSRGTIFGSSVYSRPTTSTAIRLVHGSIDGVPVDLRVADAVHQSAAFAEEKNYKAVPPGEVMLVVEQGNSPGAVRAQIPAMLAPNTEYTLFLFGEAGAGRQQIRLMEDLIARPGIGRAHIQVLHAAEGISSVKIVGLEREVGPVAYGTTSGFVEVASGMQVVGIISNTGAEIGRVAIDLAEHGEATLMVTGSASLGTLFFPIYRDRD